MTNRAIVIGIDKYWLATESLDGAVADATDFASWLVETKEVAPANLHLGLLPRDEAAAIPATLAGCQPLGTSLKALKQFFPQFRKRATDTERLYFFFSGHGASSTNAAYYEEAICLSDFTDEAFDEALAVGDLIRMLKSIVTHERFIFIDGCRNTVTDTDIRFGTWGEWPKRAPGVERTFILRATGPGREAAELSGRGLFSAALGRGLRGLGSAKRWDPAAAASDGAYLVRWGALTQYVDEAVRKLPHAQQLGQLVYREGEAPAGDDPCFAQFPANHFQPAPVKITLKLPTPPPHGAKIVARRNDSFDEAEGPVIEAGNLATFTLVPSVWTIRALADGYRSVPQLKPIAVYDDPVEEEIELAEVEPPGLVDDEFEEVIAPDSDRTIDLGPGVSNFVNFGGDANFRFVRGEFENRASFETVESGQDDTGWLELRVDGRDPAYFVPQLRISIARESGEVVSDNPSESTVPLAPGIYRVRIATADGAAEETHVAIEGGETAAVDLTLPGAGAANPALLAALLHSDKPLPENGFAMPSEAVGPVAGATLATVAALSVGQAVHGYAGQLASLGLGAAWQDGRHRGVTVAIADERLRTVDGPTAEMATPRVHLWTMSRRNSGVHARLRVPASDVALSAVDIQIADGGYWLEIEGAKGRRRNGFKLATIVLSGHVTLVVRHQLPTGQLDILQFAIRQAQGEMPEVLRALVQAEALQRARMRGRDPSADPAAIALLNGDWFEPFSAMLTAAALLDRGAPEADLDALLHALEAHAVDTADVLTLRAMAAERTGDPRTARDLFAAALARREVPLIDSLLDRLNEGAGRHLLRGEARDWIAEKARQALGHPLWTLRREDDKAPGSLPEGLNGGNTG